MKVKEIVEELKDRIKRHDVIGILVNNCIELNEEHYYATDINGKRIVLVLRIEDKD